MTLNSAPWDEAATARMYVCSLTCLGVALSSAEWLQPWSKLTPGGLFIRDLGLKGRTEAMWLRAGARSVLLLRCVLALLFLFSVLFSRLYSVPGSIIFVIGLLSLPLRTERFGLFNALDGAEHLSTTICLSLGFTYVLHSRLALQAALAFVAFQGILEYSSAGWVKIRDWRGWLSGQNLSRVFQSSHYGQSHVARLLQAHRSISTTFSAAIIVLEILMPLAIVLPTPAAYALMLAALSFHLACACLMGLNTFAWAFPATFAAILYCRAEFAHLLAS